MDDRQQLQQSEESINLQFPWKLHVLLDEAEEGDFHNIVSWLPNGIAFKVHNKERFSDEVLPKYFTSSKFKSFQRNLNLWGFRTQTKEPGRGAIYHPLFQRGQSDRCHLMQRVRVKKRYSGTLNGTPTLGSNPTSPAILPTKISTPSMSPTKTQQGVHSPANFARAINSLQHALSFPPSLTSLAMSGNTQFPAQQTGMSDSLIASLLQTHQSRMPTMENLQQQQQQPNVALYNQLLQASANAKALEQLRMILLADSMLGANSTNNALGLALRGIPSFTPKRSNTFNSSTA